MISVVIITKNEEKNIQKCIKAVESAFLHSNMKNYEIVVVDSNSSDFTLKYLEDENVKLIKLTEENKYFSAAMGRAIGAKYSQNDIILFLDADMRLDKNWFNESIEYLTKYDGIIGEIRDVDEADEETVLRSKRYNITKFGECRTFGGALMIKKQSLMGAGNYNPYIKVNEENELYGRLKSKGYAIVEVPRVMANHYTPKERNFNKIKGVIFPHYSSIRLGRALGFKYSLENNSLSGFIGIKKEFYISIVVDLICIFSFLKAKHWILTIQILLMLYYICFRKFKTYFLDKVEEIKFFIGLFSINREFDIKFEVIK